MERACVVCNYTITNPVCTSCLEKEVVCWAADHNENLAKVLLNFNKIFPNKFEENTRCIVCGDNMNICPHCYCKDVSEMIDDDLLKDTFIETFNFELA